MKMHGRIIGSVCVGLLWWLCASQVSEASSIRLAGQKQWIVPLRIVVAMRAGLIPMEDSGKATLVSMKGSIVQGSRDGIEDRLRSDPGRMNNSAPAKGSPEPVQGQAAPPAATLPPSQEMEKPAEGDGVPLVQEVPPADSPAYAYRPDGRRDPFLAIVQDASRAVEVNLNVPPLQRVNLSEITLIGIVWGGFGYIAMVQTPDGRGYTVREGTRIGSSEGLVSSIGSDALTIKEPYSDIFGRREMREQIIPLHQKINVD